MDTDIEELKEEVARLRAVTEDTNHTVHKIRRGAMWGRLFQIVWWLAVLVVSAGAYYYYLAPYVTQIEQRYTGLQQNVQQAQNFEQQVKDTVSKFLNPSSTTSQAPQVPQPQQ